LKQEQAPLKRRERREAYVEVLNSGNHHACILKAHYIDFESYHTSETARRCRKAFYPTAKGGEMENRNMQSPNPPSPFTEPIWRHRRSVFSMPIS